MRKEWTKDIHDRMGNHEKEAPEGLWEGICEAIPEINSDTDSMKKRSKSTVITMLRTAGVAAAACIVVALALHINDTYYDSPRTAEENNVAKQGNNFAKTNQKLLNTDNNYYTPSTKLMAIVRQTARELSPTNTSSANDDNISANNNVVIADNTMNAQEKERQQTDAYTDNDNSAKSKQKPRNDSRFTTSSGSNDNITSTLTDRKKSSHRASRWSISTGVSGMTGTASDPMSNRMLSDPTVGETAEWRDSPMLGIAVLNKGKETEREYNHHLPVRMGISLAYRLNDRWSIESGVTYTRLSSDTKEGTLSTHISGSQRLNYVGIPLNVKYNALSYSRFSLYASAGVMTEKCVSGNLSRNYIINNESRKTEQQAIESKPLQLSVNAAAGVQYDVVKNIGIFAEPGLSYYFDDRSSLSTIYKEKPLNFSFSFGLRCTLNGR